MSTRSSFKRRESYKGRPVSTHHSSLKTHRSSLFEKLFLFYNCNGFTVFKGAGDGTVWATYYYFTFFESFNDLDIGIVLDSCLHFPDMSFAVIRNKDILLNWF